VALTGARYTGWQGLWAEQDTYLDQFWDVADVEIDGDPVLQEVIRFGLFHLLQAGARAERRAIAAKVLTGPGYDGHAFWDTEGFVLPLLTYTLPHAAADAAHHPGPGGGPGRSACPGRRSAGGPSTARNTRCIGRPARRRCTSTPSWPAPSISAGRSPATPVLNATADSRSSSKPPGSGRCTATTGAGTSTGSPGRTSTARSPDDNTFTDLMGARYLRAAACTRDRDGADRFGVGPDEARWRTAADAVYVPL
jgi:alpha,alpha-trehalose phosphorylase